MASSHKQLSPQAVGEISLLPAVQSLLHAIAVHSIRGDPEEDRQFRARCHKISESIEAQPSPSEGMAVAESAIGAMRDHNERAHKFYRSSISELREVVQVLIGTLQDLTIASPKRMQQLEEIEKHLLAATGPAGLRDSKLNLSRCLAEIREEAKRHGPHEGDHALDPVTGLEGRHAAEAAIAQACESAAPASAVVLLVDRLSLYNRRYGRDVGDKVLGYFVEFVKRSFEPGLAIFRWTGPAVLLLRAGSPDGCHAEMRRVFDPRIEFEVDSGSRSILLTIGVSWSVAPMMVDPRLVVNKIDAFVSD